MGFQLLEAREEAGFSQEKVAKAIGVTLRTYRRYEEKGANSMRLTGRTEKRDLR